MTYAFPHNTVVVDKEGGIIEHHRGMTLRDYFAAKAMQSMGDLTTKPYNNLQTKAEIAYQMADAMLKARKA
jgi:hypothetical protein